MVDYTVHKVEQLKFSNASSNMAGVTLWCIIIGVATCVSAQSLLNLTTATVPWGNSGAVDVQATAVNEEKRLGDLHPPSEYMSSEEFMLDLKRIETLLRKGVPLNDTADQKMWDAVSAQFRTQQTDPLYTQNVTNPLNQKPAVCSLVRAGMTTKKQFMYVFYSGHH